MSSLHPPLCRGLIRCNLPVRSLVLIMAVSGLFLPFVSSSSANAQTATFQGIGDLPGGIFDSRAYDISPDGSVVVGRSLDTTVTASYVAIMWTESGGIVPLGDGGMSVTRSLARAVSINGEVIVGEFYPENSSILVGKFDLLDCFAVFVQKLGL